MSLDRKTLEAVLGLQRWETDYEGRLRPVINGGLIEASAVEALLKGLTEAKGDGG